jgi:uncharacterized protein DUF1440
MALTVRGGNLLKGLAAGLLGGIAGGLAMDLFQSSWSRITGNPEYSEGAHSPKQDGSQVTDPQTIPGSKGDPPGIVKVASAVSRGLLNRELTSDEKKSAAPLAHYAFSATTGALYGVIAELKPEVTALSGLPFGAAVWLAADEMGLPLFGLAKPPQEYPLSKHVFSLAAHFVYGLATESARRLLRKLPID